MSANSPPNNSIAYGLSQSLLEVPKKPIEAERAPTSNDIQPLGTIWVDKSIGKLYGLSRIVAGAADWEGLGGPAGALTGVTSITALAGSDLTMNAASGQDLIFALGDDAASNKLSVTNNSGTEVASIDSTGFGRYSNSVSLINNAGPAGVVQLFINNSDNVDTDSHAKTFIQSGGTGGGDALHTFRIGGSGQTVSMGIDNSSANDDFLFCNSTALGTNTFLTVDGSSLAPTWSTQGWNLIGSAAATPVVSLVSTSDTGGNSTVGHVINIPSGGAQDALIEFSISGGQAWIMGLDNSTAGDNFSLSAGGTLGSNNVFSVSGATNNTAFELGNVRVVRTGVGVDVLHTVENEDNTNASSNAASLMISGGASGGDAYSQWQVTGAGVFTAGIDNSDGDSWVLAASTTLGASNVLRVDGTSSDVSVAAGNLAISTTGKGLQVKGGAATDMVGTATLASGTITVNNTNIATGDLIFIQRIDRNGSSAIGYLSYTISAATSFTINSDQFASPGTTETNDTSILAYQIIRPL